MQCSILGLGVVISICTLNIPICTYDDDRTFVHLVVCTF